VGRGLFVACAGFWLLPALPGENDKPNKKLATPPAGWTVVLLSGALAALPTARTLGFDETSMTLDDETERLLSGGRTGTATGLSPMSGIGDESVGEGNGLLSMNLGWSSEFCATCGSGSPDA
jgi:hypothetical protein